MKKQVGLLVALLFIIAGCSPEASGGPQASATTAVIATLSSANSGSAMTTYVDQRSGIAFDYPTGWSVIEPPPDSPEIYSYSMASYDLNNPSNINGPDPSTGTKIDITFYGKGETPESASKTVQSDVDSGMVVIAKQETRTAPDGSTAYYYAIQGRIGGNAQAFYTSVNGHTIGVVAYGDGAHFEDVVKSLRRS